MSEEIKLHDPVKPFEHKPEKRGADGKIVSARYYGTHIVGGSRFFYFYDDPTKFYDAGGQPIHSNDVPDVCKKHLAKMQMPKPNMNVSIKSNKKSGEAPEGSLI